MIKKLLVLSLLLLGSYSYSVDIHVDQTAPAGGDGLSWATAFQDIQSALTIANADDTILIAQGIYQPVNTLDINVPLTIRGGYPAGGGLQNPSVNITSIQGDLDPANLLPEIFDITVNSETTINGVNLLNGIDAIYTVSDLNLSQVNFQQFSSHAIFF